VQPRNRDRDREAVRDPVATSKTNAAAAAVDAPEGLELCPCRILGRTQPLELGSHLMAREASVKRRVVHRSSSVRRGE